ncbi:hypothetical protein OIK40_01535 [Erythrobacter sp. sf7]|uniref:Replication protein n=1 Tax=Erythrobacter fulvus TaxID=2987523 RepID=A0ABT5JKR3_9SPHN|nr:hypothetical protein [Erythrobacter fulvus]MDC8753320.1 hypothetical protein [Erythrobacter fulvus]
MAQNALAGLVDKYDLVGPTVDDDVRRIIARWGAEAVKESVKVQTKPKRGRKPEKDWPLLWPYIERDAREWLDGGDPYERWTDYSIAKDYADKHPGQSHPAVMKRITKRLKAKRKIFALIEAERISTTDYPYTAHLRALAELTRAERHPVWASMYARAKKQIDDYTAKYGAPPDEDFPMMKVQMLAEMPVSKPEGSQHLGLLERYSKQLDAKD